LENPRGRGGGDEAIIPTLVVQKLILFNRGKAISGAPIIIGTNQLPNPPIKIGMTMKKIMIKAWAVMTTLYS